MSRKVKFSDSRKSELEIYEKLLGDIKYYLSNTPTRPDTYERLYDVCLEIVEKIEESTKARNYVEVN